MKSVAEREPAHFLTMEITINFQLDLTLMSKSMGAQTPPAGLRQQRQERRHFYMIVRTFAVDADILRR
jgi:hypothetical protein